MAERRRRTSRASINRERFPDWTVDAACRDPALPGRLYRAAFADDVAQEQEAEDYQWPVKVRDAIERCSTCPVKAQCLEYSIRAVPTTRHYGVYGGVPGRIREHFATKPCPTCKGLGYLKTLFGRIRYESYSYALEPGAKGFPCQDCHKTGKVPDLSDAAIARCADWSRSYAVKKEWLKPVETKEEAG